MRLTWLALLLFFSASAADRTVTWQDVHLRDGEKITVIRTGGSSLDGAVVSATQEELTLRAHRKNVGVAAGSINAIRIRRDTVRWRIIGTSLGVGIGLVGGAAAGIYSSGVYSSGNRGAVVWAAVLAGCTVGGYTLGRLGDRRTETWTIRPSAAGSTMLATPGVESLVSGVDLVEVERVP